MDDLMKGIGVVVESMNLSMIVGWRRKSVRSGKREYL